MQNNRNGRKKEQCFNLDCKSNGTRKNAYVRGLCENCYRTVLRLIEAGKLASISEAEDRGLCRSVREPGSSRFPVFANRKQVSGRATKSA